MGYTDQFRKPGGGLLQKVTNPLINALYPSAYGGRDRSATAANASGLALTKASYKYPKTTSAQNTIASSEALLNYLNAQKSDFSAQLAALTREVPAPYLNTGAINAQARKQATKAVNPFYTKQLNDFLSKQGLAKKQQEGQAKTDIKNYEDILKQTLEGNQITGERTTEDVAQNVSNINTQADQFQTDSGEAFDTERFAQAQVNAQSGLTGGLGAQRQEGLQAQNVKQEGRQTEQFNQQKQQQELLKARTFEDLARSGELAKGTKAKGVKQTKFDLDFFLKNQKIDIREGKRTLAKARQEEILSKTSRIAQTKVNNFIRSLSNPGQRNAAYQAYSNVF